jgi:hypothetical protein
VIAEPLADLAREQEDDPGSRRGDDPAPTLAAEPAVEVEPTVVEAADTEAARVVRPSAA